MEIPRNTQDGQISWKPEEEISTEYASRPYIVEAIGGNFHGIRKPAPYRGSQGRKFPRNTQVGSISWKPEEEISTGYASQPYIMEISEDAFHDVRIISYIMEIRNDAVWTAHRIQARLSVCASPAVPGVVVVLRITSGSRHGWRFAHHRQIQPWAAVRRSVRHSFFPFPYSSSNFFSASEARLCARR